MEITSQQIDSLRSGRHGRFYAAIGEALRCSDRENRDKLLTAFGHDIERLTRQGGLGSALEFFGLLEESASLPCLAPFRMPCKSSKAGRMRESRGFD